MGKRRLFNLAMRAVRSLNPLMPRTGGLIGDASEISLDKVVLGRTGLRVTSAGLGTAGRRLGYSAVKCDRELAAVVRRAFDLGINLFDSANDYESEHIVGRALSGIPRDRYVLSTKVRSHIHNVPKSGAVVRQTVEESLRKLKTDHIDIYLTASPRPDHYARVCEDQVPVLLKMKDEGKIRFVGLSERFTHDTEHELMNMAVAHDHWDVFMMGFNVLNQTARSSILPKAAAKNIGTICMFPVRNALKNVALFTAEVERLVRLGEVRADDVGPLLSTFSSGRNGARLPDLAYRFARDEPGFDTVLFGTGQMRHLEADVLSFTGPPLSQQLRDQLSQTFSSATSSSAK